MGLVPDSAGPMRFTGVVSVVSLCAGPAGALQVFNKGPAEDRSAVQAKFGINTVGLAPALHALDEHEDVIRGLGKMPAPLSPFKSSTYDPQVRLSGSCERD